MSLVDEEKDLTEEEEHARDFAEIMVLFAYGMDSGIHKKEAYSILLEEFRRTGGLAAESATKLGALISRTSFTPHSEFEH